MLLVPKRRRSTLRFLMTMVDPAQESPATPAFLAGGGELGELCRRHDWAASPLGEPHSWPQSLKTAVGVMLRSRQPVWVGWGRELTFFYNDAYKSIIGGKHPWALGRPTSVVWSEIWDAVGPDARAGHGRRGGHLRRRAVADHASQRLSGGNLLHLFLYARCPTTAARPAASSARIPTTRTRVIGDRQLTTLRAIGERLADVRHWRDAGERAAAALATNTRDVPFALLYMLDDDGRTLSLAASAGIAHGHAAAPAQFRSTRPRPGLSSMRSAAANCMSSKICTHASTASAADGRMERIADRARRCCPSRRPETAVGAACSSSDSIRFDCSTTAYRDFLNLVAGQIGGAIANARGVRGGTPARRGAGRTRSRQDHVLLQRQPRVPHAADADARPARGSAARVPSALRRERTRARRSRPPQRAAAAQAGQLAAGFLAHRSRPRAGHPAADRSRRAHRRSGQQFPLGHARRPDSTSRSTARRSPQPVYVDRDMWEKIVLNLLSNAFKFTFEGSIRVALCERGRTASRLMRADTGIGIPERSCRAVRALSSHRGRARAHVRRQRHRSGAGAGARRSCTAARLRAESELGEGTTFHRRAAAGHARICRRTQIGAAAHAGAGAVRAQAFVEEALRWLPDGMRGRATERRRTARRWRCSASAPPPPDRARVLLADDNADMRDYIARLLGGRARRRKRRAMAKPRSSRSARDVPIWCSPTS